jgi:hypothetical protein
MSSASPLLLLLKVSIGKHWVHDGKVVIRTLRQLVQLDRRVANILANGRGHLRKFAFWPRFRIALEKALFGFQASVSQSGSVAY